MGDFVSDVVTAFNQARLQLASDFTSMREDNMKFYRTNAQDWVHSVAKQYGDDSWRLYGTAIVAGVGDVLLDVAMAVGEGTFIDPLRLGEGTKKGGVGYIEDAFRVVGVVGGVFKLFKLANMKAVAGGPMSCTPTSVAKATRFASVSFVTMEEVGQGTGAALKFGVPGPLQGSIVPQVLQQIQNIVKVEVKAVNSIADVQALVAQRKGPVVFSVLWKTKPGVPGSGHTMMAFQTEGGAFRLADQFGNAHTFRQGAQGLEIIAGPGSVQIAAGKTIGTVGSFFGKNGGEAYLFRETVVMQAAANATLGQRIGIPLLRPLDREFNLKLGFAAATLPSTSGALKKAGTETLAVVDLSDVPVTDTQKLVGWWFVWVDTYFWTYVFEENGNVRWTDPYNHRSGTGKWDAKSGIKVRWSSSTTVETWNLPLNVNQQTGTYQASKGTSPLKAVRIGGKNDGVVKNVVGRWKVKVSKWSWIYEFYASGRMRWTDPMNGQTGNGQWTFTKEGLYTWWTPASKTTETWKGPLDARSLTGTSKMSSGTFPLSAEKIS